VFACARAHTHTLKHALTRTTTSRDALLKEIRHQALFASIPMRKGDSQSKVVLSVSRTKWDSFNLITSKEGKMATTVSEAAVHILSAFGKDWRKQAGSTRDARRKLRASNAALRAAARARDSPWPISIPDREALSNLHKHTAPGDRWIVEPKVSNS